MILLRVIVRHCNKGISWTYPRTLSSSALPSASKDSIIDHDKYKKTPGEVYEDKVQNQGLTDDSHQREVVGQFDHLYDRLKGYKPPVIKKNFNILSALMFGTSAEEKRTNRIPRGVYVWGTVGGGNPLLSTYFDLSRFVYILCRPIAIFKKTET